MDCEHVWISNSGRGGAPEFALNRQMGSVPLMHVRCENCSARTWMTREQWEKISAIAEGPMKIFEMTECEWFIGPSLEACKADYLATCGEDCEDARELTDSELDGLIYTECDEDERPTGVRRTFREQLAIEIADGGEFPRLFAITE